jgi:hypothetical protein
MTPRCVLRVNFFLAFFASVFGDNFKQLKTLILKKRPAVFG